MFDFKGDGYGPLPPKANLFMVNGTNRLLKKHTLDFYLKTLRAKGNVEAVLIPNHKEPNTFHYGVCFLINPQTRFITSNRALNMGVSNTLGKRIYGDAILVYITTAESHNIPLPNTTIIYDDHPIRLRYV